MIRRSAPALAAVLLLAGALAVGALLVLQARSDDARHDRTARAVALAAEAVTRLTTVSPESAEDDTARVLALAGGDFRDRFAVRSGPYTKAVRAAGASATGTVVAAGAESGTASSAPGEPGDITVLVAAGQEVSSAEADGPPVTESLTFRFRVTVADGPDGPVVSELEFVR
ncbi:hypothetical protein [Tomitella fengzijianii]|uniref:Mce-associated membrane protein n=1 Tax=Tomitella fengzijianii TaxID=2597660 RepID=A0A516X6F6_9ACTN|nr:hypothetical protein [Tomitella fengzijianii]QDQ98654.1 hypothetical protein FO059_16660 [Tomitella fengzijianii]